MDKQHTKDEQSNKELIDDQKNVSSKEPEAQEIDHGGFPEVDPKKFLGCGG